MGLIAENVRDVANRVSQNQRTVQPPVQADGFLITLERGIQLVQISFHLPKTSECLRQQELVAALAAQLNRFREAHPGLGETPPSARLIALLDQSLCCVPRHAARVAQGNFEALYSPPGSPTTSLRRWGGYSLFSVPCLTMERMSFFLFKTEPDVYSFDDFLRDKETTWDGVTNPTAVKHLREMKAGTKWIFYHTGDERTAVGTGTVVSVDPTDPKVPIVKVKAGKRLKHPKTLAEIKAEPLFAGSPLVVIGRLSVVPLTQEQWDWFVA